MKRTVVYGPPGTGKTTFLIKTIKDLIDSGISTNKIGFCSFTKSAAEELSKRSGLKSRWIGTIHSFAFKLTGTISEQILADANWTEFSNKIGIPMTLVKNLDDADEGEIQEGDEYLGIWNYAQSKMNTNLMFIKEVWEQRGCPGSFNKLCFFIQSLQEYKKTYGFVEFSDLLSSALTAPSPDLDVLIVDEAQDLSPAQWACIKQWIEKVPTVYVAGDDDQSIYTWSGADPQGMIKFEINTQAERVVLNQSYRVPKKVHSLAEAVILSVHDRVDKVYNYRSEDGLVNEHYGYSNVRFKADEDTLVLFRNHSRRRDVENAILTQGIPYRVKTGRPSLFDSTAKKAITFYISLKNEILPTESEIQRFKRFFPKFIQDKMAPDTISSLFEEIKRHSWEDVLMLSDHKKAYFKHIEKTYGFDYVPKVRFATIHSSKGDEAERVVLCLGLSKRTAKEYSKSPDPEHRTFYVGITRAKQTLDIVHDMGDEYKIPRPMNTYL